jgi:succinate dehydrogenase hydrophobic anchor subunit
MLKGKHLNRLKVTCRASFNQRITAAGVFFAVAVLYVVFALAAKGTIQIDRWVAPCGFKQRFGLPCPTCGITTSMLTFAQGKIFQSFYIQPAGALLCCVLVVTAFFALLMAVFGVYFNFLRRFINEVKITYIILAMIIVVVGGWIVTLARALAAKRGG